MHRHSLFLPTPPWARETVSVPWCCTSTYCFTNKPYGPGHGSRSRIGLIGRDFRDLGACLRHHTSGASHSFVAASCVKDLGLEVETFEQSLHVSSPIGTRVRVDQICWDYELEISKILLTVDLRVMDMSEFDVILGMDWLIAYRVIIDCDCRRVTTYTLDGTCIMFQGDKHDALPRVMYDTLWHGQLTGWLASLTLEDGVR